ncbi:hypothetical protein U1Q18_028031 [Sarracenia purpurea var. burkii]
MYRAEQKAPGFRTKAAHSSSLKQPKKPETTETKPAAPARPSNHAERNRKKATRQQQAKPADTHPNQQPQHGARAAARNKCNRKHRAAAILYT